MSILLIITFYKYFNHTTFWQKQTFSISYKHILFFIIHGLFSQLPSYCPMNGICYVRHIFCQHATQCSLKHKYLLVNHVKQLGFGSFLNDFLKQWVVSVHIVSHVYIDMVITFSLNVVTWGSFGEKNLFPYMSFVWRQDIYMFLFLDLWLLVTPVCESCWQKFKCSACHFLSLKIWHPNSCIYLFWMILNVINVSYEKKKSLLPNLSLLL